jgi:hypothetical protein
MADIKENIHDVQEIEEIKPEDQLPNKQENANELDEISTEEQQPKQEENGDNDDLDQKLNDDLANIAKEYGLTYDTLIDLLSKSNKILADSVKDEINDIDAGVGGNRKIKYRKKTKSSKKKRKSSKTKKHKSYSRK